MERTIRVGALAVLPVALFVVTAGCRGATEVTVVVRTAENLPCSSIASVSIVVAGNPEDAEARLGSDNLTTKTDPGTCDADGHTVGSLVVTPGESAGAIVVAARLVGNDSARCEAPDYKGCIVARRTFTFVKHASVTLPVSLDISCLDVPCGVVTSCRNGTCVSSTADCSEDTGTCTSPAEPTPAEPTDGSSPDGATDAQDDRAIVDAHADGPTTTPDASGVPNGCPVPGNVHDCASNAQVCCLAAMFSCQTGCTFGQTTFDCIGREHCEPSQYCCSQGPGSTVSCDTTAGQACTQGGSYICSTNGDCPPSKPNCTKPYAPSPTGTVYQCE